MSDLAPACFLDDALQDRLARYHAMHLADARLHDEMGHDILSDRALADAAHLRELLDAHGASVMATALDAEARP